MAKIGNRTPEKDEFNNDQIVVATSHRNLLVNHLALCGVDIVADRCDDSPELGLTLLELRPGQVAHAAAKNPHAGAPAEPLSRLLHMIYHDFKKDCDGWHPTVGKNRTVRPVIGAPHNIGGGGRNWPTKAGDLGPRTGDGGRDVRVGIADSALFPHPWLRDAYDPEYTDVWGDGELTNYVGGHSTFIAGLVLQRAPAATLKVCSVLGPQLTANSWDVAKKLVRFARSGMDVLNLSFGCITDDGARHLVLTTALDRISSDTVVVAAAGNHGNTGDEGRPSYPAADAPVVGVTAVDADGRLPEWSTSSDRPWIDVVAYGDDVTSTFPLGEFTVGPVGKEEPVEFTGFAKWSGTSFATAVVAGEIAKRAQPGKAVSALADLLDTAPKQPVQGAPESDVFEPGTERPWIK